MATRISRTLEQLELFFRFAIRHPFGLPGFILLAFFLIVAAFPWLFTPYTPDQIFNETFAPPSPEHPCGTDYEGRDVWAMIVWGTRPSLAVGIIAALLTTFIGGVLGIVAGYMGGIADYIVMLLSDVLMLIPSLLLLIVFGVLFSKGFVIAALSRAAPFLFGGHEVDRWTIWDTAVVISLISWPSTARIVRAQVIQLKHTLYVEAARAVGAPALRVMFKHIAPQTFPLILARIAILTPGFMVTVASLSFLGLGDDKNPDWGYVMYRAFTNKQVVLPQGLWQQFVIPGLFLAFAVLAFICVGEVITEYLNPRRRAV